MTGELNGHRVVARDDELGTEHLGQPEVAATLSLRYRPLRDVLLPHDWQSRVPTERQQKSRAFHRAEDAVEGHRVARGGQAEVLRYREKSATDHGSKGTVVGRPISESTGGGSGLPIAAATTGLWTSPKN